MEKVLSNDLTKYIMLLGAGVLGIGALTFSLIARARGSFKPYQKSTILYIIFSIIFFAIIAVAAHPSVIGKPFVTLICFQAYFLLLGSAHIYFMNQQLSWSGQPDSLWSELFFTLLLTLFGSIVFLLVYQLFNQDRLGTLMAASTLFFIVPFVFYQAYRTAIAIPPKIIKEWFYPVGEEIDEPEDSKLKNMLVISFEFQKKANDASLTNFRAKAPAQMDFGQLFYYFLNDYNEKNPSGKVQYVDTSGSAYGWVFYKKNDWYHFLTRYIDAEKTISSNSIKENDVIICTRTLI
jgi:hypothetical protein